MTGNKLDPKFVVLRYSLTPLYGNIRSVKAVAMFDARVDARTYAKAKNSNSTNRAKYVVQRVVPGPTFRGKK
jgi:hypothetical protein